MNKGIKGIAIVIVIVLALALGLSACDKTEYYSVNVTAPPICMFLLLPVHSTICNLTSFILSFT